MGRTVMLDGYYEDVHRGRYYEKKRKNEKDGQGWKTISQKHNPHWYLTIHCKCGMFMQTKRMYEARPIEKELRMDVLSYCIHR